MDVLWTGVLASLLAAFAFFGLMVCIRPRLRLSPELARGTSPSGPTFRFKIVNRSRRAAVNVRFELVRIRVARAPNGPVNKLMPIPLRHDGFLILPGRRRRDPEHRYARRVLIDCDLDDFWDSDSVFLELNVYAVDGLSSFGRQFTRRYHRRDSAIVSGTFEIGSSMAIE